MRHPGPCFKLRFHKQYNSHLDQATAQSTAHNAFPSLFPMAGALTEPCRALSRQLQVQVWHQRRPARAAGSSRRSQLAVQASSFVKQLVIGAAGTAALAATVVTMRKVIKHRQEDQQPSRQLQPQRQQQERDTATAAASSSGWLPALPRPAHGLGWPLQDRDKQLAQQVSFT